MQTICVNKTTEREAKNYMKVNLTTRWGWKRKRERKLFAEIIEIWELYTQKVNINVTPDDYSPGTTINAQIPFFIRRNISLFQNCWLLSENIRIKKKWKNMLKYLQSLIIFKVTILIFIRHDMLSHTQLYVGCEKIEKLK